MISFKQMYLLFAHFLEYLLLFFGSVDVFNARLARGNFVAKANFDSTEFSLNNKISINKTKNESNENEIKKL